MNLCVNCGSPICGKCGKCIEEFHPKRPDGSIVQFGLACPFKEAES